LDGQDIYVSAFVFASCDLLTYEKDVTRRDCWIISDKISSFLIASLIATINSLLKLG